MADRKARKRNKRNQQWKIDTGREMLAILFGAAQEIADGKMTPDEFHEDAQELLEAMKHHRSQFTERELEMMRDAVEYSNLTKPGGYDEDENSEWLVLQQRLQNMCDT